MSWADWGQLIGGLAASYFGSKKKGGKVNWDQIEKLMKLDADLNRTNRQGLFTGWQWDEDGKTQTQTLNPMMMPGYMRLMGRSMGGGFDEYESPEQFNSMLDASMANYMGRQNLLTSWPDLTREFGQGSADQRNQWGPFFGGDYFNPWENPPNWNPDDEMGPIDPRDGDPTGTTSLGDTYSDGSQSNPDNPFFENMYGDNRQDFIDLISRSFGGMGPGTGGRNGGGSSEGGNGYGWGGWDEFLKKAAAGLADAFGFPGAGDLLGRATGWDNYNWFGGNRGMMAPTSPDFVPWNPSQQQTTPQGIMDPNSPDFVNWEENQPMPRNNRSTYHWSRSPGLTGSITGGGYYNFPTRLKEPTPKSGGKG